MDDSIKKNVDHPSHYNQEGRKECIVEMREKFGDLAVYWFCKLNAYKYGYRAGTKDGNSEEQDKAKIKWYDDYAEKLQAGVKMDDVMKALKPWDDSVKKYIEELDR